MTRHVGMVLLLSMLVCLARAEVDLVERWLSADALLWVNGRWQYTEQMALKEQDFTFYRRAMYAGLTARLDSSVALRAYFDASRATPLDLYVDFRWPSGVALRVGQFVPPLGTEAWTRQSDVPFIEYSMLERHWKPWGAWDIGVMASYTSSIAQVAGAVVNGSGRGDVGDENKWKDVCGSIGLSPLGSGWPKIVGRGYYGRYYEDGVLFWNSAVEVLWDRGPLDLMADFQHAVWGGVTRNSARGQVAYGVHRFLEPVFRAEIEFQSEDKYSMRLTGGVNSSIIEGRLRLMVNYSYLHRDSRSMENRVTQHVVVAQLQATL